MVLFPQIFAGLWPRSPSEWYRTSLYGPNAAPPPPPRPSGVTPVLTAPPAVEVPRFPGNRSARAPISAIQD